jgi:hypothetical protein
MANMKTIGMLLIVAVILVAVAVVIRQQSTAPPKPSVPCCTGYNTAGSYPL